MISRGEAVEAKTQNEILSQPGCWEECFRALDEGAQLEQAAKWDAKDAEYVFIGCGSSYYISQAASASWGLITGRRAWAVPASEVLLYPDLVLNGPAKCQPVLVSRSGHSSEVVRAAQYLERTRNIRTLAISCSTGHPLEEISAFTIHLLPADEKSVVMTRSFTSMLLGLQSLAAHVARRKEVTDGLRRLPAGVQPILDSLNPRIQEFVQVQILCGLRLPWPGAVLRYCFGRPAQDQRDVLFLCAGLSYTGIPPRPQGHRRTGNPHHVSSFGNGVCGGA